MDEEKMIGRQNAPGQEPEKQKEKLPPDKTFFAYLHDIAYIMAVIMVLFLLLFRVVIVYGPSMNDTLMSGDYLLLLGSNLYHDPQQGDIIVALKDSYSTTEPVVKRVIATEGQTVDINFASGIVYVDGVALEEPYIKNLTTNFEGTEFPLTVTEGHVFVMGDNRQRSMDSRDPTIGLIDEREILGKVIFLLFPGTNNGEVAADFSRIGVVS